MRDTIFNWKHRKGLRRVLRHNPTPAEKLLWQKLRGKKLGVKFRRQHGIDFYIVDFCCPKKIWL